MGHRGACRTGCRNVVEWIEIEVCLLNYEIVGSDMPIVVFAVR